VGSHAEPALPLPEVPLGVLDGTDGDQPLHEAAWLCPCCPARQPFFDAPADDLCAEFDRLLEDATVDRSAPNSFNLSNVQQSLTGQVSSPGRPDLDRVRAVLG
jgi:hypothetical protein